MSSVVRPAPSPNVGLDADIVGDRHSLLVIGMLAVWLACLVFASTRLVITLWTGKATPWWANAMGLAAITLLYAWYRPRPQLRSPEAAHGTALVATLALLVPVAYGMSATIWWLSLVGFAMVLLGRRQEARLWGVAIPIVVLVAVLAEPYVQVENAVGEPPIEAALAKASYVLLLIGMAAAFRGVAERRATALHVSEERYRMLFQRVPVGVVHYDGTLRVTDCNQHFCDIFSAGRDELTGFDMSSLHDPRLLPTIRQALAGEPSTYDGPFQVRADSAEVSLSVRTVALRGTDGTVVGAIGMVADVSDRRLMEAELQRAHVELEERVQLRTEELRRRSRALLAITQCNQALARAGDETALLDEVCRIIGESGADRFVWVAVNESSARGARVAARFGSDRGAGDRLLARSSRLLKSAAHASAAEEQTLARAEAKALGRGAWHAEIAEDGAESVILLPLCSDDMTLGVLGVAEAAPRAFDAAETELLWKLADDIAFGILALRTRAARELAERALRESEERYRLLFERNLAGVFRWSLDGRVIDCNDACARIFGYGSREEMLATPVARLFDTPEGVGAFLERLRKDGQLLNEERRCRHKEGRSIWVIENVSLAGDVIEGTLVDVTERRLLEDQVRQAQKMESIGSLAGGVAHDFNNLMSVILSFTEFAAQDAGPEVQEDLQEVKKAADRAVALTRQLLAFGRKQILRPAPLDLNQIASGIEKMLRRILGEDVTVAYELASDLAVVLADPGQIEQVLMNLVVNARDAMPGGGKLTIATANVELDDEYAATQAGVKPGSYVELVVTDTGSGMDAQTQARIFEPFFTTKAKGKGTGLGLATVYGIVKQSGGGIAVESEVGKGTTFRVYLPRDLTQSATQPTAAPSRRRVGGTETILLVEDEDSVRSLARRILVASGYTVIPAANGNEALVAGKRYPEKIHLLLTDVVMPEMSGRVLAGRLTEHHPETVVLYMSGYTDDAIVHHGVLDPGTHFLAKPFNAVDLTRKVREVLNGASAARRARGGHKAG